MKLQENLMPTITVYIYSTDLIQNSRIPEVFKSSRKIRNIFTVHVFLSKSAGSYMYVY